MSTANSHHMPSKGKGSRFPGKAAKCCDGTGHRGAQALNATPSAQTPPPRGKLNPVPPRPLNNGQHMHIFTQLLHSIRGLILEAPKSQMQRDRNKARPAGTEISQPIC